MEHIFEEPFPEDDWLDGELEEELHPIYMTRNEILFLDDSLTMMLER